MHQKNLVFMVRQGLSKPNLYSSHTSEMPGSPTDKKQSKMHGLPTQSDDRYQQN